MLPAILGLGGLTAKLIATAVIPRVVRAISSSFSTTRPAEPCPPPPVEGISSRPEPAPAPVLSGVSGTRIRSRKWGYAGLWHHGPSGLDLATYRLYDAANKRWISRDPLGEGVDYNLYRYCGNNPISMVDPLGLELIPFDSTGDVIINSGGPFDSSREDVEKVKCSLGKIFRTKRGKELRKRFSKSNPWRINLNSTSTSSGSDYLPTQTAVLDAGKKNAKLLGTDLNVSSEPDPNNISPRLNRNTLQLTAPQPSQERILAHELGHAATLSGEDAAISAEDAIMNDPAMGNTDPGYRWPTFTGHAR